MNSQPINMRTDNGKSRRFPPFSPKWMAQACCLIAMAGLFSGCARLKQYSLDSWQGPIPMHDLQYVEGMPQ